jgi:hypothetical protein
MRDLRIEFDIQTEYLRNRPGISEASRRDAVAMCAKLVTLQEQYTARYDTLTRSGELTSLGLKKALAALGLEFQGKVKTLQGSVSGLDANIQQTAASLAPPAALPGEPVLTFLKEMEIRANLKTKDPLELGILYRGESPGSAIAAALEHAPIPMVSPELIAEVHAIWARETNPEAAARLDAMRELASMYTYCFKVTLNEFPIPEVEPAVVAEV